MLPPTDHDLPLSDPARADSPWIHPPSGVLFLQQWGRFRSDLCQRYDVDGRNVSVRYGVAPSLYVSAYVFPIAGHHPDECPGFAASVRDMLASLVEPREVEESVTAFARPGSGAVHGRRMSAFGTPRLQGATPCKAVVEQFTHDGWAVKLRMTCTLKGESLGERFMNAWLRDSGFGPTPLSPSTS